MHIKFLARGTGSARDAADYLLGERDAAGKPREGVEVLRGNPDMVAGGGRLARLRAPVHLWRDRLGTGRPTHRRANRGGPGRLREDRLGGTGLRPLRMDGGAAPRARRRRSRPRPRGAMRPGDRAEPQHRPSGMAEDVRSAPRRLQPRTRLEPSGRSGAGQGGAARPPRVHRGGAAAGRAPARILPPRPDPGLPAPACRARNGAESPRGRRRPGGGGSRCAAPGQGLHHGAGPRQRGPVAAERRTVRI